MVVSYGAQRPYPGVPAPINWADPITDKLVSAFNFNEHVGPPRDLVNNKTTTFTGTPTYIANGMNFVAASTQYLTESAPVSTAVDNISISGWARPTTSGVYQYFVGNGAANGVTLGLTSANTWNIFLPTVAFCDLLTSPLTSGKWHHFVAVRLGGTWRGWIDNIEYTVDAPTSTPVTPTTQYVIGSGRNPDLHWTGDADNILYWERPLSRLEVQRLFLEPWCAYGYQLPDFKAPGAAAAFKAAWARNSNVLVTPGLSI